MDLLNPFILSYDLFIAFKCGWWRLRCPPVHLRARADGELQALRRLLAVHHHRPIRRLSLIIVLLC